MLTNLWLCVQEMKAQNNRPDASAVVAGNEYILQAIPEVEDWIVAECEMDFVPRIETIYMNFDQNSVDIYNNHLLLTMPFLEITSVAVDGTELTLWDGQASTRTASDYYITPRGKTPIHILQGLQPNVWLPDDPDHYIDGIEITGITGYHTDYPKAWKTSGATVGATSLTDTATSLIVSNASGVQFDGSPRFSEGQLLRIGTEFLKLWSIDTGANTLTVERGVLGSTAAAHATSAVIEVWHPQPQIVRAATRWAIYMAKRRATYDTVKLDAGAAGNVTISTPAVVPEEVAKIIAMLANPYNKVYGI